MDELWKNYVEDPSDDNRNAIVEKNLGLVKHIANPICKTLPPNACMDDIMQAGMMALIASVPRYDHKNGATFGTYASYRIRGAILDTIRDETGCRMRDGKEVKPSRPTQLHDSIPAKHSAPDIDTPEEIIREKCKGMPLKYLEVFVLHYAEGMSFAEIAEMLGLSTTAIYKRHNSGLEFLRNPATLAEFAQS